MEVATRAPAPRRPPPAPSPPQHVEHLVAAAACLLAALLANLRLLRPDVLSADALVHLYWAWNFRDPQLFTDGLTAELRRSARYPDGYEALVWPQVANPIAFGEWLGVGLMALSGWLVFAIVREHTRVAAGRLDRSRACSSPCSRSTASTGGFPRAFVQPVGAAHRPAGPAGPPCSPPRSAPPAGALFYPPAAVLAVGVLCFVLLLRRGPPRAGHAALAGLRRPPRSSSWPPLRCSGPVALLGRRARVNDRERGARGSPSSASRDRCTSSCRRCSSTCGRTAAGSTSARGGKHHRSSPPWCYWSRGPRTCGLLRAEVLRAAHRRRSALLRGLAGRPLPALPAAPLHLSPGRLSPRSRSRSCLRPTWIVSVGGAAPARLRGRADRRPARDRVRRLSVFPLVAPQPDSRSSGRGRRWARGSPPPRSCRRAPAQRERRRRRAGGRPRADRGARRPPGSSRRAGNGCPPAACLALPGRPSPRTPSSPATRAT